ncbi:hypothetical protein [Streptomyces sp. NPDC046862]|uniref:hypothetical protein n=1 Tax=Streptomyces sp. NPDC046862 TaxID=3154603 RepID=UPI0034557E96
MNTAVRITVFAAALAATFGTAYGVGTGIDPVVAKDERPAEHGGHSGTAKDTSARKEAGHGGHEETPPGGLQISENGYTLDLRTDRIDAGKRQELRFAVQDSGGRTVTAFKREHDKELHLIVASRDLTTYRHLHPTRAADGTWSTPVDLPKAGSHRVFADFTPAAKGARNLTLGADLAVAGTYKPDELPGHTTTAKVDGYEVTLNGRLRPGAQDRLTLSVSKDGKRVRDLQPYLGAYGHLVALRDGDLAYLHVHPNGEPGDGRTRPGPAISFTATAPSSGAYRLFLDFKHQGKVRTVAFTVHTDGTAPAETGASGGAEETDGHDH